MKLAFCLLFVTLAFAEASADCSWLKTRACQALVERCETITNSTYYESTEAQKCVDKKLTGCMDCLHVEPVWYDQILPDSPTNVTIRGAEDCNGSYEKVGCSFCAYCSHLYGPCPCRNIKCLFCGESSICCPPPKSANCGCGDGHAKCWCS